MDHFLQFSQRRQRMASFEEDKKMLKITDYHLLSWSLTRPQIASSSAQNTEMTLPLASLDELTEATDTMSLAELIKRGAVASNPQIASAKAQNTEMTMKPMSLTSLNEPIENPEIIALRAHPQLANQYRILRTIGRGSQGTVYEARDLRTGKTVAIKALSFREIADWKASDLFMREIALLKSMQIEGTPHYIDAIDATASSQPYYFLVQDFIPGKTLETMLNEGKIFFIQEVIAIALAIIPILEKLRAYSPPIVHRDIKPSNIMMTPEGDIYLIDFGAAMFHERGMGGSTFAGTAGYMAPEQCMGTSTPESDVYGLGATLIHLLTGTAPYKMQMRASSAVVPIKKKNRPFLTVLRKPFAAIAGAIRKRWRTGQNKRHAPFPGSMTLRFKPYLPKETPLWLVELLEVMVAPYPNERAKDLNTLVHAIRTRVELDGHSVHSEAAAHLGSMDTIKYQFIIPTAIVIPCILLFSFELMAISVALCPEIKAVGGMVFFISILVFWHNRALPVSR